MRVVPPWGREDKRNAILSIMRDLNARGITSATDAALGPGGTGFQGGFFDAECISVYNDLHNEGLLTVRMNLLYLFGSYGAISLADFEKSIPEIGIHSGFGDEWLKIGGIKLFADGIPQTKTAWLSQEYPDGGFGSLVLSGVDGRGTLRRTRRHDRVRAQARVPMRHPRHRRPCDPGFHRRLRPGRARGPERAAPLSRALRPDHARRYQAGGGLRHRREHPADPEVGLLRLHRSGDRHRAVGVAVPAADLARCRRAREPLVRLARGRA